MNIVSLTKRATLYIKKNGWRQAIKRLIEKIRDKIFKREQQAFDREEQESYLEWIQANEPTEEELEAQRKQVFSYMPKISIVVPMYNTKERYFRELVESVLNQTYSNVELCFADGSTDENMPYVQELVASDDRIVYKKLGKNFGIAINSNEAIKLATGDYVALLDHDDIIPIFAVYEIVKAVNEDPEAEFIYTDEDKLMEYKEQRMGPHFKSDYGPDTLRSYNYICHFSIFKKSLMDRLVGFDEGYEGSQDYDIILRATETANRIIHIPKILYHWRINEASVALSPEAKPYAYVAAKKAIAASLQRQGIEADVTDSAVMGLYKIKYHVTGNPLVSIIILNKDHVKDLEKCLQAIEKSTYQNYEVIIVENNSEESKTFEYYETLKSNSHIKVITYDKKGFNYSAINNYGVKHSQGEYIVLLNNDIEIITKDWLETMLGEAQRKDIGVVGAKLLYPNDTVQHAGVVLGLTGIAGHVNALLRKEDIGYMGRIMIQQNFSAVTGAMMMLKKEIYVAVGGLDEDFAVAYNDIDLCLKIRELGKYIVYDPYVQAYHYESRTRGYEDTEEKKQRLQQESDKLKQKWQAVFAKEDPFFNPNFRHDIPRMRVRKDKADLQY